MKAVATPLPEPRRQEGSPPVGTVTIRDVARAAEVSVASASRALNGHSNVTPATRQRVVDAADALGYVPHLGARNLSRGRSNTIGVVLPDLFGEFFSEIIRGIDYAAHRRGLQILLTNMHGSAEETRAAIRAMRGRVDGLLVMSPEIDVDFLGSNLPRGLPAVLMNAAAGDGVHPSISVDNLAGARAAVSHLAGQGCVRIAHLTGPRGNADADARREGYRAAVAELPGEGAAIEIEGDFSEASGFAAARRILAARPAIDGLFAANDMMAVACMSALIEAGKKVPDDIAIVGFDGVPIAQYVTPGLSTLALNLAGMGERAFDRLVAVMDDPDAPATAEMLVPELVVRASSHRHA